MYVLMLGVCHGRRDASTHKSVKTVETELLRDGESVSCVDLTAAKCFGYYDVRLRRGSMLRSASLGNATAAIGSVG